jgi:hypothetical protein
VRHLAGAHSGDRILVGACTIEGPSITIPRGVTVEGFTTEESILDIHGLITVEGGDETPSAMRRLTVLTDETAGILAEGPGRVTVEDLDVVVTTGRGISAEDLSGFEARRLTFTGPVTERNADGQPFYPDDAVAATYGLAMICVDNAALEDIDATGFAFSGVAAIDSVVDWTGGHVGEGLGTGAHFRFSRASVSGVEISGVLQGTRLIPSYGLVTDQSLVSTHGLHVHDSQGYGALYNGGESYQTDALFEHLAEAGSWVQLGSLEVSRSHYEDNALAGIATYNATDLTVRQTSIVGTLLRLRIVSTMAVEIGSGLLVRGGHHGALRLQDVEIRDSEGWGALVYVQEGFDHPVELTGVTVSPATQGFGVLGTLPDGWSAGISPPEATTEIPPPGYFGLLDRPSEEPTLPPVPPSCHE